MKRSDKLFQTNVAHGIIGFIVFSIAVFLIGLALGIYEYDPADDGYIGQTYNAPIGDRRY